MSGYGSRRRSGAGRREVAGGGGGAAEELDSPEKKAEEWKPVRRAQERSSRGLWSRLLPINSGFRIIRSVSGIRGFRFWVPRYSTRTEPDPLPSLRPSRTRRDVWGRPFFYCW